MRKRSKNRKRGRFLKILLIIGFLSLLVSIFIAHFSPADDYEVSIYAATPIGYWFGNLVAISIAVGAAIYSKEAKLAPWSLTLGGLSMASIIALPMIRGYKFFGQGDPLTHLGWARSMAIGELSPFELIYPGSHILSVNLNHATGLPVTSTMMLTVILFAISYLVFIPLIVWVLIPDRKALVIAGISGFLLFFINNIGTYRAYHTFSLATFFFPVVLYFLLRYIISGPRFESSPPGRISKYLILPMILASLVLIHSQVALNVFILISAFAVVQSTARRLGFSAAIGESQSIHGQALFLGVFLVLWSGQHPVTYNMVEVLNNAIANTLLGGGEAGAIVDNRGDSASAIGVSLLEFYFKLFLVATVYTLISGAIIIEKFLGSNRQDSPSVDAAISCFAFGGFALVPFFLLHFLGHASIYFFRHVGFSMVIATILGSIALYSYSVRLPERLRTWSRPVILVLTVCTLILCILTIFNSPFIYLTNPHVTDQQFEGYDDAFDYAPSVEWQEDRAVWFTGIRAGPGRYDDAILDREVKSRGSVNETVILSGLPSHYASSDWKPARRDHYLPVTDEDRKREVVAYNEVRYSKRSFDSISSQPGVHRVQTNGDFTLYYIDVSFAQ